MTINFNLYNPQQRETLIYVIVRFGGTERQINKSIGAKVLVADWNDTKQQVRKNPTLNGVLNRIKTDVQAVYNNALAMGEKENVREAIIAKINEIVGRSQVKRFTFFDFLDLFIKERQAMPSYAEGTVKIFKTLRYHLHDFALHQNRKYFDFKDITLDWFYQFTEFLFSEQLVGRKKGQTVRGSINQNTASKYISALTTILNEATERGYNSNLAYKSSKFAVKKTIVDKIFFTVEELTRLHNFDLKGNDRLQRVRFYFLVGSFTGLRDRDCANIKREHFITERGNTLIKMRTKKSNRTIIATIPVHPIVRNLFEQCEYSPPAPISNQKMNKYIKELCELAGFTNRVPVVKNENGKLVEKMLRKCDEVETHTMRRNFITNGLSAGIPIQQMMAITGLTLKTLLRYDKATQEDKAIQAAQSSFFSDSKTA